MNTNKLQVRTAFCTGTQYPFLSIKTEMILGEVPVRLARGELHGRYFVSSAISLSSRLGS